MSAPEHDPGRRGLHPLAVAAAAAAVVAVVLLVASGPGTRADLWHFSTGFRMLRWAAYSGIAAVVLGIAAAVVARPGAPRRGFAVALVAVLLGGLAFWLPWSWQRDARGHPPIHDITTDSENPPAFEAVAPLRRDAPNPVEYGGDPVAEVQREHYPGIAPAMLAMSRDSAFGVALAAAREMGWAMVDADRATGRIEATATTPWFGFRDDVVIRVTGASGIARVDVRSKSRVGRGDAGENARRITRYLERLRRLAGDAAV